MTSHAWRFSTQSSSSASSSNSSSSSSEAGAGAASSGTTGGGASSTAGQQQEQQQQQASSSGSGSGSSSSGFDANQAFEGLKQGFEGFKQRVGSNAGSSTSGSAEAAEPLAARASKLWSAAVRDLRDAVLPRHDAVSMTRAYDGPVYDAGAAGAYDGPTALAAVQQPKTRMQQVMDDLREKVRAAAAAG